MIRPTAGTPMHAPWRTLRVPRGGSAATAALAVAVLLLGPGAAGSGEMRSYGTAASASTAETVWVEVDDDALAIGPFGMPVEALTGMPVFGANEERIGSVDGLLATLDGEIGAVSVALDAGILAIDERAVVIPLSRIQRTGDLLSTDLTQAALGRVAESVE